MTIHIPRGKKCLAFNARGIKTKNEALSFNVFKYHLRMCSPSFLYCNFKKAQHQRGKLDREKTYFKVEGMNI